MDTSWTKRLGRHGMRVSPRCRGAASSMLRVSHATASAFGGLGRSGAVAPLLTPSLVAPSPALQPMLEPAGRSARQGRPLFTRLWPSAAIGHESLWQDTFVALD